MNASRPGKENSAEIPLALSAANDIIVKESPFTLVRQPTNTILSAVLLCVVETWRWLFPETPSNLGRRRPRYLVLEELEPIIAPAQVFWTGVGDNLTWNDQWNWSTVALPTQNDDVDITGANKFVRVDNPVQVKSLVLDTNGGALGGTGAIDTTDFTWLAGKLSGTGVLYVGGSTTISGGANTLTLEEKVLVCTQLSTWDSGVLEFNASGQLKNQGQFYAQPGATSMTPGANVDGTEGFINYGQFFRTGGIIGDPPPPNLLIDCGFDNVATVGGPFGPGGQVYCYAGEMVFSGDDTSSGSYGASPDATISFTMGTHVMNGVTFNGLGLISVEAFAIVQIPSGGTVTNAGNFKLASGGTIQGSGTESNDALFVNNGAFRWELGTIKELRLTNTFGHTMTFAGVFLDTHTIDSSLLTNLGQMTWESGNIVVSYEEGDSTINNLGDFVITGDDEIKDGGGQQGSAGYLINNTDPQALQQGVIRKTAGAANAATVIEIAVDNYNLIDKGGFNITFAGGLDNHQVGQVKP